MPNPSLVRPDSREIMGFFRKQDVKGGQRTIYPGDILLKIHFFLIQEGGMDIYILFQNPQAVTQHHDLVKKSPHRNQVKESFRNSTSWDLHSGQ